MNNEKKLGLDSAFPVSDPNTALAMFNAGIDPTGMSKRFYAACAAMQGLLANPNIKRPYNEDEQGHVDFANVCYQYADGILKTEQL